MSLELELLVAAPALFSPASLEACERLSSPLERAARARLTQPRDRALDVVTRALVRSVLASRVGLSPHELSFVAGSHGRPRALDARGQPLSVDHNVAHTDGLVVCVVGPASTPFGVDVERVTRPRKLEVARDFFAPAEVAALERAPEASRQRRFYDYWTLKEAYIKARGLGLAIPLDAFWLSLDEPPRVTFEPWLPALEGRPDDARAWSFAQRELGPHAEPARPGEPAEHLVAIAARSPSLSVSTRRWLGPATTPR